MEYHIPVLLKESIDGLNIKPDGIYVDLTFGGGGHSIEILKKLRKGLLIAFDQDEEAEQNKIKSNNFLFINSNFKFFRNFLRYHKINQVDGILADLGVSSHHFDQADRGFSFRFNGNLDMRMDQNAELTAEKILNTYSSEELLNVFNRFGEIKNAYRLVKTIIENREIQPINSIEHFKEIIKGLIPKYSEYKYLAKVFQALRIEVNDEINVLKETLLQTGKVLKKGGRLVVLTYHSLEDRLVKNYIKAGNFEGKIEKDFYGNKIAPLQAVNRKVIVPSEEEIKVNNRARSAKLRIAEK
ncbi:MAG: 16S rRNA (cytosine(1402)-N(4))-methyltransferase RsmH [Chlorobi bacterium]|nr:16S rRNA (cytosine(1402)-N(4))-methyltransferase RsmH [Chlorobiota bacterium]